MLKYITMFNISYHNSYILLKLSKFAPPGPGPGSLGGGRRADGGPDNGRAAEWAHGGRAHGPRPMGQGHGPRILIFMFGTKSGR